MLQVTQCIDLTTFFNQWRSYEPRGQEFESLRAHHTPERPIPSRSRPFCIPAAASGSRRQTLDIENANHPIRTGPGVFAERLYSKRLRHAQHHNSSLGSPFKRPAAMRVFFVCQPESSLASGTTTLASRAARLLTAPVRAPTIDRQSASRRIARSAPCSLAARNHADRHDGG